MAAPVVGVLGRFAGLDLTADDWKFLEGPVVQHDGQWRDTTPRWMYPQIMTERAEIVFGQVDPRFIVGPTEIAAVMYPACMEHPMAHDAVELYSWASINAAARQFGHDREQLWRNLCGEDRRDWRSDDDVLGGRHGVSQFYRDLAHEIRRRVIQHSKYRHDARQQLKERAGERAPTEEVAAVANHAAEHHGTTYDIFERFRA